MIRKRLKITKEGYQLIKNAKRRSFPEWLKNQEERDEYTLMANCLTKIDGESEDGIFGYSEYMELKELDIQPLEIDTLLDQGSLKEFIPDIDYEFEELMKHEAWRQEIREQRRNWRMGFPPI